MIDFNKYSDLFLELKIYLVNLLSSFLPITLSVLIGLLITPLLINNFGTETYGIYILSTTISSYFGIGNFGLPQSIVRKLIEIEENDEHKRMILLSSILNYYFLVIIISFVIILLVFHFDTFSFIDIIVPNSSIQDLFSSTIILSFTIVSISLISQIFESILLSKNKIYIIQLISFSNRVLYLVIVLLLLHFNGNLIHLLISNIVLNFLTLFITIFMSKLNVQFKIRITAGNWNVFKELIPSSFWYFAAGISVILVFQIDSLVISSFLGLTALTIYSLAFKFSDFYRQIMSLLPNLLFPKIAELYTNKHFIKIKKLHNLTLSFVIILSFFGSLVMNSFGYKIYIFWIGESNALTNNEFFFFIVFASLFIVNQVSGLFLGAMGIHKNNVLVGLVQGLLNLLLSIYFARIYGLIGVIAATIVSLIITNLWYSPYLFYKEINKLENCNR